MHIKFPLNDRLKKDKIASNTLDDDVDINENK